METRLQKWGNSNGVRIPSSILKTLDLKSNDKVEIKNVGNKIIISKIAKEKISLNERMKKYNGKNEIRDFEWE